MRRCAVCGNISKTRKCPNDGFPTLRVIAGSGREIEPGSKIGERYLVTELIGQGGFGKVFGVQDQRTGMQLAVKVLAPVFNAESEDATRRFVREAHTTSMLTHGNTIRVLDYGQTQNEQLFLVMERLHGEPLNARLRRFAESEQRMPAKEIISIGTGVLSSLGEAHSHGLVHRDMKPENIFLHQLGKGDIIKVLDFGIVREKGSQMTQAGQPIGTPTHMSPEQAMGDGEVDARSDLYSLGVCLYECAAARLPIDRGANSLMTMMAHVSQPSIPLSETAPALPEDLAAVITKALEKEPKERYQTALEMRGALQSCAESRSRRRKLTVVVGAEKTKKKRSTESHRLLQERRTSRLNPRRSSDNLEKIPRPPPPLDANAPPPVRAAQDAAVSVQSKPSAAKSGRRGRIHFATTQPFPEDIKDQVAAAKKKRSEESSSEG
jgi:eukaryotic-like serine/threonine-protein kinase